jgi:glutamate-5-semialdehyde dehydrogenase
MNQNVKRRRVSMTDLQVLGKNARFAAASLNKLNQEKKNQVLENVSKALVDYHETILAANALIDRLTLNFQRVKGMADGLLDIAALNDPIGEIISMANRPNGLTIGQKRVPIGVIGIIYESRPNVTADAFGLCFKTGNAVILRGGSDAIHSNLAIVDVIKKGLVESDITEYAIQLVEDTSRETARELMRLNKYLDLLIPRGGAGLIKTVVENSTVPVIETGTGNCHIFVDESADFSMALDIIDNAKTQRLGVCNACESLVVHQSIAQDFLPLLYDRLTQKEIEIRGDERARSIISSIIPATEEDYATEYLDKIISLKLVDSLEEGIAHINLYNTKHSEAIITSNYSNAMQFLNEIDAAAVYVNASTRFTDGSEFGFGAEIGISTQKLHARGPMGLLALTSTKYIIFGNGQIRP